MNLTLSARLIATAALAAAALGATTAAQARSDVYLSIGVPARQVYVEPAPVYVPQRPAYSYYQAEPAYVQQQSYYVEPEVYVRPVPPAFYSWQHRRAWEREEWRREQAWRLHHRDHRGHDGHGDWDHNEHRRWD